MVGVWKTRAGPRCGAYSRQPLATFGKFCRLHPFVRSAYALIMSRKLRNWSYRDATDFLRENGFRYLKPLKGSHQAWFKGGEDGVPDRRVEVSIPRDSYGPKTIKNMVRQSGIRESEWIRWGGS